MNAFERVGPGVIAIDTEYVRPRMDAAHLLVDAGRAAFIDVGTHFSLPNLLAALAAQGVERDAVDYVLLTHIHLDHAGGAGELAALLPCAKVLVHPRGASHLIDPQVLIAATRAVYGAERYAERYGEIRAIAADRLETVRDGARVVVGTRTLEVVETPGHALHHVCYVERDAAALFTGDTFGLSYREFDTAAGEFIFPTTSPTQFDPLQLHASIERLMGFGPKTAYLTHYSRIGHLESLAEQLHHDIDAFVDIARDVADLPQRELLMRESLYTYLSARLDAHGFVGDEATRHRLLDDDIALNAAGLDAWLRRRAA